MSGFSSILILLAIPARNASIVMVLSVRLLLGGAFIYGEARACADMSSRGIVPATF